MHLPAQSLAEQVGNLEAASAEYAAVMSERDELRRRQNMLKGALQHIRDAVRTAERELSSHLYVDIDIKYRKQLIELRTTEMAGNDLEKYHKVSLLLSMMPAHCRDIHTTY